jgi:decaprenylphospho-beta-D-erythro-pentofuranosid-2-ulose 2-reductase
MSTSLLIFGATSTIAAETASNYLQRLSPADVASVVLIARDPDALARLQADISSRIPAAVHGVVTDLADIPSHATLLEQVQSFVPAEADVHALIAYGELSDEEKARTDTSYFETQLRTNFVSVAHLTQSLATWLTARSPRASLAVITSVAGDRGRQSNYIYGAAKGGLIRFLEGLAHFYAKSNLAIIDIRPGFVDTKMTARFAKNALWAKPEKVATAITCALRSGKSRVVYTPCFWRVIMLAIRHLPTCLLHRTKL